MAKVKIKSFLQNKRTQEEYKVITTSLYNENKIQYLDNDMKVEIHFLKDEIIMKRRNKEVEYIFFFSNKNSYLECNLLKEHKKLKLKLTVEHLKIGNNNFQITYKIEENDLFYFTFSIIEE